MLGEDAQRAPADDDDDARVRLDSARLRPPMGLYLVLLTPLLLLLLLLMLLLLLLLVLPAVLTLLVLLLLRTLLRLHFNMLPPPLSEERAVLEEVFPRGKARPSPRDNTIECLLLPPGAADIALAALGRSDRTRGTRMTNPTAPGLAIDDAVVAVWDDGERSKARLLSTPLAAIAPSTRVMLSPPPLPPHERRRRLLSSRKAGSPRA